jgi:molybdopterin/thiamine biosynthesis adenylyltransferase
MHRQRRLSRQSFLGANSESILKQTTLAIVGLGGGGSHIAQQAAYAGIGHVRGFDFDRVEDSNLNRMIGAEARDLDSALFKTEVISRMVQAIDPDCDIKCFCGRWEDYAVFLRECDIIVGCVDSYSARAELEATARRFCIPYVDIGMDVHEAEASFGIAGQLFVSLPGETCMWCANFLKAELLEREAARYGAAGARPQVVWANGFLASTAIGLCVDLLTGFTGTRRYCEYLTYDGNIPFLMRHPRLEYVPKAACAHYPLHNMGDPMWYHPRAFNLSLT